MTDTASRSGGEQQPPVILRVELAPGGFAERWAHCAELADHVAGLCASEQFDSAGAARRLSACVNELLEFAWRHHQGDALVSIEVARLAPEQLAITVRAPVDAAGAARYAQTLAAAADPDAARAQLAALLAGTPDDAQALDGAGLLELIDLHGARLSGGDAAPGMAALCLSVAFE